MEEEIKKYLKKSEVVFVIGLPESGRSYQMREIGKKNDWLVVNIPAEVEPSLDGFSGVVVVNSLDSIINDKRMKIWRKLITYYHQNPGKVKFVFGQGCEEVNGIKELLGSFYSYYGENRVWFGIGEEYWPLKKRFEETGERKIDSVVRITFETLWECLSESSQTQLIDLVRGKPKEFGSYLTRTGVVRQVEDKWQVFSPLFLEWLREKLGETKSLIEMIDKKLFLNKKNDLSTELSYQEYSVLELLWKNQGIVVRRNDLAEILWPKDTEDKYSDWAIDQIMSKVRRKIGDVGENRIIKTIKGQGFVFSQE